MVSPGDSSVPANRLPIITQDAPAASALEMSPEYLIPPSAMSGTSVPCAARAASMIAVNCGTPAPVTTRVVQIDPGPMPTFKPSTPREINSFVPSYVATFPAMRDRKSTRLNSSHGYISYAVFCLKKKKLINTHAHFDHAGGVRYFVAEGATVITQEMNKSFYQQPRKAPRHVLSQHLAQSRTTATF